MSKEESRNADYCQKHYLNNTQALISGHCITGIHLVRASLCVPCSQRAPLGFPQTAFSANLAIRKHLTSGQHHSQKGSLGSFKKSIFFSQIFQSPTFINKSFCLANVLCISLLQLLIMFLFFYSWN